jgi:hypothetical protein
LVVFELWELHDNKLKLCYNDGKSNAHFKVLFSSVVMSLLEVEVIVDREGVLLSVHFEDELLSRLCVLLRVVLLYAFLHD